MKRVLIIYVINEGSGEAGHLHSLARALAVHLPLTQCRELEQTPHKEPHLWPFQVAVHVHL